MAEEKILGLFKKSTKNSESVVFKGYKSGLTLIIPENVSFVKCLDDLTSQLHQANGFFKGAVVTIQLGKRNLLETEFIQLSKILTEAGLIQTTTTTNDHGKLEWQNHNRKESLPEESIISTITIKRTIRSGQRLEYDGNLVIMGDVNPGAELVATGDVIVLGKLRGTVHAGAKGNQDAKIIAFQLKPIQIRIAGVITRAPEWERGKRLERPETARINDNQIIVERCY